MVYFGSSCRAGAHGGMDGTGGVPGGAGREASVTELVTEQQAATLLHVSKKALQGWRYRGEGPRFVKVGRCVRYRHEDLQTFVLAALRTSTSDPGPTRPDRSGLRIAPARDTMSGARTAVPASAPTPRPHSTTIQRLPTLRRQGFPHIRIRARLVLPNQDVTESTSRPTR